MRVVVSVEVEGESNWNIRRCSKVIISCANGDRPLIERVWQSVINFQAMVDWGTISAKDLDLFFFTDDVDEALDFVQNGLIEAEKA